MSVSWVRADWPAPGNVIAGTTTRVGGVSTGAYESLNLGDHVGDDETNVRENRRRFVAGCALPSQPAWLRQVHGTAVSVLGEAGPAEADAAIGRRAGDTVAVLTADCLPLLLCSADGREIAAVHCGWRGLAAGVVSATVSRMASSPAELVAWMGPAISQSAFEVGADVRDAFLALDEGADGCFLPNGRGRWQADLFGLARCQLAAAGVRFARGGGCCTFGDAGRFFSHRRDGRCGRMASFVHRRA